MSFISGSRDVINGEEYTYDYDGYDGPGDTSGTRAMERKVERASRSRSSLEKAIQSTHLFHLQMTTGRFALHTMLRDAVVVATGFMFAECVDAGNRIRCGSTTKV